MSYPTRLAISTILGWIDGMTVTVKEPPTLHSITDVSKGTVCAITSPSRVLRCDLCAPYNPVQHHGSNQNYLYSYSNVGYFLSLVCGLLSCPSA